jgi:hypothetical protein
MFHNHIEITKKAKLNFSPRTKLWMLRRVALLSTDVSEELGASFIRVKRIGELGTTLAVTTIRRRLTFS